ncbi:acetyl-CoA carboxylase biotin carboxyl carrier protein [Qiania dongpingensis]|uniref:Biotin carboxyl carrier protein of acetyl-CoA carboxylase n=1 Tax=Qiania dongpingensis TaxID=2763669 RepID=A0A7G9G143_9FIRM|nr:acetyl-CoA carboxylase biotin carboxyl carrier protein [Qiania dongpingensis]QNM04525.1 acetyl-CoA carboxylase biotin carboxyl carrier protein [Qiania dongpingensis]
MEFGQIIKLIETVSASGLTSFELEDGGTKISLTAGRSCTEDRKAAGPVSIPAASGAVSETAGFSAVQASGVLTQEEVRKDVGFQSDQIVKSPLVGIFYAAPSEEAEPFVKAGDTVKKGQVLGIIEAMKLMNEIECDYDGVVEAVLIENEQVVEYGQPLFRIR